MDTNTKICKNKKGQKIFFGELDQKDRITTKNIKANNNKNEKIDKQNNMNRFRNK